ncbi:hypothetical protein AB0C06_03545 [Micromonospora inaquosa]|uniref:Uncharacterized protein n=1 Tax=Micromonospora inaquosa TaxID=2203716 RepID=A0A3N9W8G4_9ACTN|nr:hypothetical protein [Micromonospora inaquosa]RQW97160.1 hypothetical protein DLJ59_29875 [Micromonospora inaquosa]
MPEHGVIDLDEHNHGPAESDATTTGRRVVNKAQLRLVAAFIVGFLLGGFSVNELRDLHEQRERAASVALVVIPGAARTDGLVTKDVAELDGSVEVTNYGPLPVTIRAVQGQTSGVLIQGTGQPQPLRPGNTRWLDVKLRLTCALEVRDEPLSMRLSVETADRQIREVHYPVALPASGWHFQALRLCFEAGLDR